MGSLAILGAGGHGRVLADCAELLGWTKIQMFDDGPPHASSSHSSTPWPRVGESKDLFERFAEFDGVVVGIGANRLRLGFVRRLAAEGARLSTLVHPSATVSRYAELGVGGVVLAGAVINAGVVVGTAGIINTGARVDHDCVLEDGVHVSPGATLAGSVRVGEASWVGAGASVRDRISIGRNVRIGVGAAVVADTADNIDLVGVPAKALER